MEVEMENKELGRVGEPTGVSRAEPEVSALTGFDPSRVSLTWIGGNCPVQAEGFVDGRPFYFRARGDGWEFWVGEPWTAEAFTISGPYGRWPDAGWMPIEAALAYIAASIHAYWHYGCDTDGSPEGRDAQQLDGEAATAGAEGIAPPPLPQQEQPPT